MKNSGENLKSGFSHFNESIFSAKEISGLGKAGTVKLLKGGIARVLNFIGNLFSYTSTRVYGFFLLAFGFASLFMQLAQYYFVENAEIAFSSLITGFAVVLLSVPFLIFDQPISIALQSNPVTDYILFEFLLIKRSRRNVEHITVPPLLAIFLGIAFASFGFLIPLYYVVLIAFAAIFSIVALTTPEFSMITTLLFLPYVSFFKEYTEIIFILLSAMIIISFLIKVVVGKRVYNFNVYDILVFLLIILLIVSGALGNGASLKGSIVISVMLLASICASNLVVNRRIADCAVKAVIFSSVPVAILSIIEFIFEFPGKENPFLDGISVFFSFPMAFSAFLLVASILSLTLFLEKKQKYKKIFYFVVFALELAILIMLMQPTLWLTVILTFMAGVVIVSKKIPIDIIFIIVLLPLLIFLIPAQFLDTVSDIFGILPSFSEKIAGYSEALNVWLDNIVIGVGRGNSALHLNMLLGLGVEFGVVALAIVALLILLRLRHLSYYRHYIRNSLVYTSTGMTSIATVALLILGFDTYIFADYSVLLLFSMIFAITTSTIRTAKKEYNDRSEYYGDSSSSVSSAVDIGINKNF